MKVVQHLVFGYDLHNIERVMTYIEMEYDEPFYKMYIGYGDDVMNSCDVCFDVSNDKDLMDLIELCEGQGKWID
jgi:hypothetical protein